MLLASDLPLLRKRGGLQAVQVWVRCEWGQGWLQTCEMSAILQARLTVAVGAVCGGHNCGLWKQVALLSCDLEQIIEHLWPQFPYL